MTQIFVELYNYRESWHALPSDQKEGFMNAVLGAVGELSRNGVEVIGYGMNDPDTDRRAPYDFFCVYRVPSVQFQRMFEDNIQGSGWHDYFEQVNVSGASVTPAQLFKANVDGEKPKSLV